VHRSHVATVAPMTDATAHDTAAPPPSWRRRLHLPDLPGDPASVRRRLELLRDYQRRVHRWFTISAAMGLTVGLAVAGLNLLVEGLLWEPARVASRSPWLYFVLPVAGLVTTRLVLRAVPDQEHATETTEAYIGTFHRRSGRLRVRDLWGKLVATTTTVGFGGSLGLEGPGALTGGTVGAHLQSRFARLFAGEDARLLMVAGAAAGVSATFRAPVTGLIFAIEVPYRDDIARHAVLPALVASATGYLGQALVFGTQPLFPVGVLIPRVPAFNSIDLVGTLAVGVSCGLLARAFVRLLRRTEAATAGWSWPRRLVVGGGAVGAMGALSTWLWGRPIAIGLGYDAILEAIPAADPGTMRSVFLFSWMLALFLAMKAVAVGGTLLAGGVGGVFTQLVVLGSVVGSLSARVLVPALPDLDVALFPLIGMAAFLGAGYHTPLAAVAFVAETTGSANYIVAGLLASALAYGIMGRTSISPRQRNARRGRAEALLDVPVETAIRTDPVTVAPDVSVERFVDEVLLTHRHREYPVTRDGVLLGVVSMEIVGELDHDLWEATLVGEAMDREVPTVRRGATLTQAAELMAEHGLDRIPVVDEAGRVIGMIGPEDVFRLGEILEDIERSRGTPR
jgi:CIC family chloride channel protein